MTRWNGRDVGREGVGARESEGGCVGMETTTHGPRRRVDRQENTVEIQHRKQVMKKNIPDPLLRPKRQQARLRQDVIHDHDPGAALEGGDEVAQDAQAVGVGPVVEDPAVEVDVRVLGRLRAQQEVVRLEGDAWG